MTVELPKFSENIAKCHRCPHRDSSVNGDVPCKLDDIGIAAHAEQDQCPDDPPMFGTNRWPEGWEAPPRGVTYKGILLSTPVEVSRREWPLFIRAIALLAAPGDKGVGDAFQRLAAKFGGEKYKRWMARHGKSCGCAATQAAWNARYPLKGVVASPVSNYDAE